MLDISVTKLTLINFVTEISNIYRNDKIVVTKFEEVVWWDSSCLGMIRLSHYD
jgi:hypothetical protein